MKKLLFSFLCMFIAFTAYSQNNLEEVVYLKNGSIIRGTIIEQIPNDKLKIQTKDGNVFVYKYDEIEKLTKEATIKPSVYNDNNVSNLKINPSLNTEMKHYKRSGLGCTITGGILLILGSSCFAIRERDYSGYYGDYPSSITAGGVITGSLFLSASIPLLIAGPIQLGKYGRAKRELQNQKGISFAPSIKTHNLDGISTNATTSITSFGAAIKFTF